MRAEEPVTDGRTFFMRSAPISVGVAVSIMLFILVYVVPKFEVMFKEMELGALPEVTKVLLAAGNLANNFWYALPGVVFVAVWVTVGLAKDRRGAFWINLLIIPLMGCAVGFIVIALFLPLMVIMDRVGK